MAEYPRDGSAGAPRTRTNLTRDCGALGDRALPDLPDGWKRVKLGDQFQIVMGQSPDSSKYNYQGFGLPLIQGNADIENRKSLARMYTDQITKVCDKGDIILTVRAPVGSVARASEVSCLGRGVCAIKAENDYLYQYLISKEDKWGDLSTGSTFDSINGDALKKVEIPLPPLPEQRRIAAALGDMDKLIENLGKRIAKKRLIKKGAMQELLTGKKRLPGFSGEWKEVRVGDIGYFYGGLSGKTASDFGHGNAHYITFLNVLNNVVIDKNCVCDVVVGEAEKQNLVKRNDLFFNGSSETPEEVAMCAALLDDLPNTYLNSFCCGFRLKCEEFLPLFISYYYNSEIGRRLVSTMAQGLTRYNLSKKSFLAARVTWPEKPEQAAIARVLSDMDAGIASLERRQAKLKLIKKGMLQDLLTGKVRI